MAVPYNHREVEKKWQTVWDDEKAFKTSDDFSKPKYYALVEFPYPSGQGLHVGHLRTFCTTRTPRIPTSAWRKPDSTELWSARVWLAINEKLRAPIYFGALFFSHSKSFSKIKQLFRCNFQHFAQFKDHVK